MNAPLNVVPFKDVPKLPHSIEAEQALLGALLLSNKQAAPVSLVIQPDHFYEHLHALIYEAIQQLIDAGREANPLSVGEMMRGVELPPTAPTTINAYLARISAEAVTIRDAENWAYQIRDLAHQRDIIIIGKDMIEEAQHAPITASGRSFVETFQERTKHIVEARDAIVETTDELAERMLAETDAAREGDFHPVRFTTGFSTVDKLVTLRPEEVIVTAGRPGAGKSIYSTSSARRQAQAGIGVLEFPLENGREQAIARHITDLAYASSNPLHYGWLLNRDVRDGYVMERVRRALEKLRSLPLVIDDASRLTIPQLAARVRQEKARMAARGVALGLVLIDHLDFLDASDRYKGNRVQEIGEIMVGLKALARRERVCIHLFSQLNRAVESREDKRPGLSDLRNSGDIEQVADVVQFLYREAYYLQRDKNPEKQVEAEAKRNDLEVIVAKNRSGRVGSANLFVECGSSYLRDGNGNG